MAPTHATRSAGRMGCEADELEKAAARGTVGPSPLRVSYEIKIVPGLAK